MKDLQYIEILNYTNQGGKTVDIQLSYQTFGEPLDKAPIVLVNHALTGNSTVTGEGGWWNSLIGEDKIIDTNHYAVLAFNIPGNGYNKYEEPYVDDYKSFTAKDIAQLFSIGLNELNIHHLFANIGGSVGGGITWELAVLRPDLAEYVIPVASDWRATDWLIANCHIQERILENSSYPLEDARLHAMTFYRTPESFSEKFKRTKATPSVYNVESWLNHHGDRLNERFKLSAYKMMNHILKTVDITSDGRSFVEVAKIIESHIHIVTINSDLFFKPEENWKTFVDLKTEKENVSIGEIKSIHGHDAFLIEFQQLNRLLSPIFQKHLKKNDSFQPFFIQAS
ncbi:alpha/beta fold hydrolase [Winogradskyella sp. A3E31]|uniref:alpha/beta fold hydrolase n=1 Tax=Winogradskyella sp. A3E31 TaxID=3349637 RepID=UPI00398A6257